MPSLREQATALWNRLRQSPAAPPTCGTIAPANVSQARVPSGVFQANQHYFQVRVNELFLANERQWFKAHDPMVVVLTEFNYDRQAQVVPCIVGPAMLERAGITRMPAGMVLADTRVAGLHPYRGGRVSLSVILCKVTRQDYARQLLSTLEGAAGALDPSSTLGSYLRLGGVVLDGVDHLLGAAENEALAGLRREFDPDAGVPFTEGYHYIINAPAGAVDPNALRVVDGRLHVVAGDGSLQAFRQADFVLYSIVGTGERTDVESLPFAPLWQRAKEEAARPDADAWKSAKANMVSLFQQMATSPDLTTGHALLLLDRYRAEIKAIHGAASDIWHLGPSPDDIPPLPAAVRRASVDVLDME